ncbi:hypothetical protein BJ912DRAFT_1044918 [Pholiota molesta]|nr:hypothetical protein BJ912DRAFT_1044918 [Pholiota molesta]
MYTGLWLGFFVLFLRSLNVLSTSVPETNAPRAAQLAGTTTTSWTTPTPISSILPVPSYTTRFTHRAPESLISSVHAKRWLGTARRKLEYFIRWIMGSVVPDIRPTREDFLYLRSLEDPVFMSVTELPPTISPQPGSEVLGENKVSTIREILSSLETELEKRSSSERKSIVKDLDQIFKRNLDTEQSPIESTD